MKYLELNQGVYIVTQIVYFIHHKQNVFQVKRMLSKNKAVNYSVMEDAINDRDTADTLAGRHQCDEDDYG